MITCPEIRYHEELNRIAYRAAMDAGRMDPRTRSAHP